MSDNEEPKPVGSGNQDSAWYGSLEGQIDIADKESMESSDDDQNNKSPILKENIQTSNEYMELDEPEVLDEKKKMLEEFERKRRARMITVPTDDFEVKQLLRQKGEPICLFGEGPADRRNRIKDFLSRQEDSQKQLDSQKLSQDDRREMQDDSRDSMGTPVQSEKEETWFHRGPASLREARMYLVNYSVPRARTRLKSERLDGDLPDATKKAKKQELQTKLRSFTLLGSQNADTRPVSYCSFSPDGQSLATSSWSGVSKVWRVRDCSEVITLHGHDSYIDCIEWNPSLTDSSAPQLVSCSRDGMVHLYNTRNSDPVQKLPKFEGRVSRVRFHPSGRFIGLCIHDKSWRLWDLSVQEEVLFQEGHSRAVYSIAFQRDGALCATGGLDNFGRVWDLRTGRCVMFLTGHGGPVLAIDWSPNGYNVVTGSEDNSSRIWDVRVRKSVYMIPSHTSIVSSVRYDPDGGKFLATASYDGTLKLWCHGSFQLLKALEGHGQKVMGLDISPDGNAVATCSFDKTFKIWGPD